MGLYCDVSGDISPLGIGLIIPSLKLGGSL